MARAVKHFSLHRTDGTELRVVADVEDGVLPVISVEEEVIRKYIRAGNWFHSCVALFILQDFKPLVRQLQSASGLPAGAACAIEERPVVNLYDLARPSGCQVFMNRQAMVSEGYWDDTEIVRALLAHEHAHPLAEGRTSQASRRIEAELTIEDDSLELGDRRDEVLDLLGSMARKLCTDAPREIFANELTIITSFADALLHLDRHNLAKARSALDGREEVRTRLRQETENGKLTPAVADLLLLIGDLQGYLDLALETAPFYRAGRESDARQLEMVLESEVFPRIEPEAAGTYAALRDEYVELRPNLTKSELLSWCERVLNTLTGVLRCKGLRLGFRLKSAKCSELNLES